MGPFAYQGHPFAAPFQAAAPTNDVAGNLRQIKDRDVQAI